MIIDMQPLISRIKLLSEVEIRLRESPVVALLGARQTGKTTLAAQVAERVGSATIFDLELAAGRAALELTPEMTLRDCRGLVIIDEVQRLPSLFTTLRPLCDELQRQATFLLLGSAALQLVRGISESLAGRVQFIAVPGFSLSELGQEAQDRLWLRGAFPRAVLAGSDAAACRWLDGFRRTFLERDLPNLGSQVAATAIERFWTMLAHYHGQTWNAAELGRAMGAGPSTANHYRDLLAGTYMLRVLPPWHENLGKRQIKAPKVYLRDSGLLHLFLGINTLSDLRAHPRYGASWEGFALEQTLIAHDDHNAFFWATRRGAELDLLLLRHGRRWGFEFKCADAPVTTKAMHIALADLQLQHLWVVYPGRQRYPLADRITAIPLHEVFTLDLGQPSGLIESA